jgi:putative Holliday junction resolvase
LPAKNTKESDEPERPPATGRLLALDVGARRVGVAVSDEMRLAVRPLPAIRRESWKKLVAAVAELIREFDAAGLVLGLPLRLDGTEGDAAREARRLARNFALTLPCPVHLQDERLTTRAADEALRDERVSDEERAVRLDSESAALILRDFISHGAAHGVDATRHGERDASTLTDAVSTSMPATKDASPCE